MPNKKNKRGSGNKNTQFENALSSSMRDGVRRMSDFYDSPGMQGPAERQREEEIRKMLMKQYEQMTRDMAKEESRARRVKPPISRSNQGARNLAEQEMRRRYGGRK